MYFYVEFFLCKLCLCLCFGLLTIPKLWGYLFLFFALIKNLWWYPFGKEDPWFCKWLVESPLLHHLFCQFGLPLKLIWKLSSVSFWDEYHQSKYFWNIKRWQQLGFVLIASITYLENEFCVLIFSFIKYLTSILVRKSLDLIESLLRLAEVGQYEQVKQLFSFPIKHCPDMLVLALLQINTSWHTLRHELISTLMPIFLGNHPNSAIILHYAWHGQVRHDHFFILIIDILWRMLN